MSSTTRARVKISLKSVIKYTQSLRKNRLTFEIQKKKKKKQYMAISGKDKVVFEHRSFARVGFLGNPSDVYFGRTISFTIGNF